MAWFPFAFHRIYRRIDCVWYWPHCIQPNYAFLLIPCECVNLCGPKTEPTRILTHLHIYTHTNHQFHIRGKEDYTTMETKKRTFWFPQNIDSFSKPIVFIDRIYNISIFRCETFKNNAQKKCGHNVDHWLCKSIY